MQRAGALHDVDENPVGQTIGGRWRVVQRIGRGGMATVYEALEPDGRRVALKHLDPSLARSPNARTRFLREGRVANAVDHPKAVRVHDTHATPDGHLFLVMEFLKGETLRQRCSSVGGHLETSEVLAIAEQVLDVLAAAHAKAIIHRDIKPENIFLTEGGGIKVLDFGIAAVRDEALQEAHITQSGASLGTPAFMAPEQARGRQAHVDARTDLWAVGATMFYCLTGRRVHDDAANANEALILAATQRVPSIVAFRPDVPSDVAYLIDRALALDPMQRWPSADSMRGAIALSMHMLSPSALPFLAGHDGGSTQEETPPPHWVTPTRRSGLGQRAAMVFALAATVGAGIMARALARGGGGAPLSAQPSAHAVSVESAEPIDAAIASAAEDSLLAPAASAPPRVRARVVRTAPPGSARAPAVISTGIPETVLDRRK